MLGHLEHVVILAGDHVCKMDDEPMLVQDADDGADVAVSCIEILMSAQRKGKANIQ
jgi:glucose-1-phosphate adenylyltransferase